LNSAGTFDQLVLDGAHVLARRQAGAVGDAEDMRVDRHGRLAERGVEHDVGRLAAHAGQRFQRFAVVRHLASMVFDQQPAERDNVFGFRIEQADAC
jgi:hypothetical protein